MEDVDNFLAHFGRKGMKWGQHIYTSGTPAHPEAVSASKLKTQARKAGVHTLSNDQLKELNTRMKLEEPFNQWKAKNPTLAQRVTKFLTQKAIDRAMSKVLGDEKDETVKQVGDLLKEATKTSGVGSSSAKTSAPKKPTTPGMQPNPAYKPQKRKSKVPVHRITTL